MADVVFTQPSPSSQPVLVPVPMQGYVPLDQVSSLSFRLHKLLTSVERVRSAAVQFADVREPDPGECSPLTKQELREALETARSLLDAALKLSR